MARFCIRCGRLIYGDSCTCKKDFQLLPKKYNNSYHDSFYDSGYWKKIRDSIKKRDFNMDRLQLYFAKTGRPDAGPLQTLYDFCIDAYGNPRRFAGRLLVHHIVPRDDDVSLQYELSNLITLNYHVHEFVHQLYISNKKEIQDALSKAVQATLP